MPEEVGMEVSKSGLKAANQTLSKTPFSCTKTIPVMNGGQNSFQNEKAPHVFTGFTLLRLSVKVIFMAQAEVLNRKSAVLSEAAYDI